MPVQIMELVIKATVKENQQHGNAGANGSRLDNSPESKEAVVKQCVEEVLRILKQKEER